MLCPGKLVSWFKRNTVNRTVHNSFAYRGIFVSQLFFFPCSRVADFRLRRMILQKLSVALFQLFCVHCS